MIGDIQLLRNGSFGVVGSRKHNVAASSTTIKAGEPVGKVLGNASVIPLPTNAPSQGTSWMVGIAATTSTNTATAAGSVEVIPLVDSQVFLIKPLDSTLWDTQTEYDALVGDRVELDLTTSTYTIQAADTQYGGCVIQPLDITKYPGKVAFSVREVVNYLA